MNNSFTGRQPTQPALGEELWNSLESFLDDPPLSRSSRIPSGCPSSRSWARSTPPGATRGAWNVHPPQGSLHRQEQLGVTHSCLSFNICPAALKTGLGSLRFGEFVIVSLHLPGNSSFSSTLLQSQEDTEAHVIPDFDPGRQGEEFRV